MDVVKKSAILEAVKRNPETGVTIRLGSDALGAIQAVKKGWSRSTEIREIIKGHLRGFKRKEQSTLHGPYQGSWKLRGF